jgi:uridine kinase
MMGRAAVLETLARQTVAVKGGRTTRVAIDGIDAAGKTALADELAGVLESKGERVIRASTDGFHNPRVVRYARGSLSAEGYFADSLNLGAIVEQLLTPLGPAGDGRYRPAIYDYRTEAPLDLPLRQAPAGAILLFDGLFLARPELVVHWGLFIFVEISFDTCLIRAIERDRVHFGSEEEVRRRYLSRYLPAQQLYLDSCRPTDRADFIVHNDDPANPHLTLRSPPG